jgi:hypothetical protein
MKQNVFSPVLTSDPPREPFEAGIYAAVPRNKLLLMARFDAESHDIERRHVVLQNLGA